MCPKCGREFKNTNQNHSCGSNPSGIGEYIAAQSEDVQPVLIKVRETIKATAPDATEKISWQMPTFWQGENLIYFCAHKKHLGIHPGELDMRSLTICIPGNSLSCDISLKNFSISCGLLSGLRLV